MTLDWNVCERMLLLLDRIFSPNPHAFISVEQRTGYCRFEWSHDGLLLFADASFDAVLSTVYV